MVSRTTEDVRAHNLTKFAVDNRVVGNLVAQANVRPSLLATDYYRESAWAKFGAVRTDASVRGERDCVSAVA
jgi:hypothetical protein